MPLDVAPTTIVLDKIRIEQFTVSPQMGAVMMQYSKGYEVDGQYVPKEYAFANFENVTFDQNIYEQVKSALYEMLNSHLNSPES